MEPIRELSDTKELHLAYLDYYRSVVEDKLRGLSEEDLRHSRLPSGWSPLELLKHLVFMERRWFRWGINAEPVDHPWGDSGDDSSGRWQLSVDDDLESLLAALHEGAESTRVILNGVSLQERGKVGGRFNAENVASVNWVCFHVLQEYARHAGHLDIVRELADGSTGETA
ncbi:DinB family protein [Kribbella deserti]|uniref:DinB family protein n=1 Tax=Kribbella deserti TaxID=1926257 RepID=A0ABV6QID6_9ACTN